MPETNSQVPLRRARLPLALVALALVALAPLALGACSSPAERRAEHLRAADQYLEQGKPDEALIELRSALKLDPKSAEINAKIADIFQEQGEYDNAHFFWSEASRLDPANPDYKLSTAKLLIFDETERARELVQEVLAADPANVTAHIRRAELALVEADSAQALEAALTAVELDPSSFLAWMQLGMVHRARIREQQLQGETVPDALFEEALAAFDRALEIAADGGSDAARRLRTRAHIERANVMATWPGHEEEAEAAFQAAAEAVRDRPEQEMLVLDAATEILRMEPDRDFARWLLERRVAVSPERLDSWLALARLDDDPEAETSPVLERMIAERPEDADAHVLYMSDLSARRDADAVRAHAERVAARTDEPAVVWAQVLRTYLGANDVASARAIMERIQREHPQTAEAPRTRGEILLAEGRLAEAARAFELAAERRETAEVYRLLAQAHRQLGEPSLALVAVDRALELSPGQAPLPLLRLKGELELALGDGQSAMRTYAELARRGGRRLPARDAIALARAQYDVGRRDTARALLERFLETGAPRPAAVLLYAREEGARNPQQALAYLEASAREYPGVIAVLDELVLLLYRTGEHAAALARLNEAIEAHPDAARLRMTRARIFAANGRLADAEADAREAQRLMPGGSPPTALVVQLLAAQGKLDTAIAELEDQAAGGKMDTGEVVLLARLQANTGNAARAIELYERVLRERSDLPGVKNDLAFLLADSGGDLERALELAREARQALPGAPQVADTLGWVYLKKQLPGPAESQFREALGMLDSGHRAWPSIQYHLGLALKEQGRQEEATQAFEKALAAAVEFPEAEQTRRELESLRAQAGTSG